MKELLVIIFALLILPAALYLAFIVIWCIFLSVNVYLEIKKEEKDGMQ